MIRIETLTDIDTLRQVALLLDRENQKLIDRIKALTLENSKLRGEDLASAQLQLELLKDLLATREKALFGDSSEKRPGETTSPSDGAANTGDGKKQSKQEGHGRREQKNLPIIEQNHDVAEAEKICKECGGTTFTEMKGMEEESDEVTVVERQFVLVRHRRKKYRCSCNGCIVTAPAPQKLQPGSHYSLAFAVEVAASKYMDHLPLERQVRIMGREGLMVDSQTLWDQINALAGVLRPTYLAIREAVLASRVVHADETWWRLMLKGETKRWWVWTVSSRNGVYHKIFKSRSIEAAEQLLKGYAGTVMADGYGVYPAVARGRPLILAHCWAHVRRKFIEAAPNHPGECKEVLDLIGMLYQIERTVPSVTASLDGKEIEEALLLRQRVREERSSVVIAKLRDWAYAQRVLPESGFGKAIGYMMGLWAGLTRFLKDPEIPLDNNLAERSLRGVVIGRKNHYGSRSEKGTQVAALFYTLVESAQVWGIEPKSYVLTAARNAIATPGAVTLPSSLLA